MVKKHIFDKKVCLIKKGKRPTKSICSMRISLNFSAINPQICLNNIYYVNDAIAIIDVIKLYE